MCRSRYELKEHKSWFDEICSLYSDRQKYDKFLFVQITSPCVFKLKETKNSFAFFWDKFHCLHNPAEN